jgi:hypothetical protein
MSRSSAADLRRRLADGFALDHLWRETMGLPTGDTKEAPLRRVIEVLRAAGTPYALIGGIAVQMHSREPRTTLDIDLAVPRFDAIPATALLQAGFEHEGRHEHSDNWLAPGPRPRSERTAVQFSAEDVGIDDAVARAREVEVSGLRVRLVTVRDLLVLKLAAAEEPKRRASKRRRDLVDIVSLAEEHPDAAASIPDLGARIGRISADVIKIG